MLRVKSNWSHFLFPPLHLKPGNFVSWVPSLRVYYVGSDTAWSIYTMSLTSWIFLQELPHESGRFKRYIGSGLVIKSLRFVSLWTSRSVIEEYCCLQEWFCLLHEAEPLHWRSSPEYLWGYSLSKWDENEDASKFVIKSSCFHSMMDVIYGMFVIKGLIFAT